MERRVVESTVALPTKKVRAPDTFAYFTIISWPKELDRAQQAQLFASTGLVDEPSAKILIGRDLPSIAGIYELSAAVNAAAQIRKAGGDAFAPTLNDLAALGPTMKIKDMRIIDGNFEVDVWRGPGAVIRREHVQIIVRASIDDSTDVEREHRVLDRAQDEIDEHARFVQYGYAVHHSAMRSLESLRNQTSSIRFSEKIDLHTSSGTVFQIDGDKFGFGVLGEMRGHSDSVNISRTCELISHIAPDAVVDNYFRTFRPPAGMQRLLAAVPALRHNNEDPVFAFYSRWAALMYRHVMGVKRR